MSKGFWVSRTFWFNAVTLALVAVSAIAADPIVNEHPQAVLWAGGVIAALNLVLRFLTTTAISIARSSPQSVYEKYPKRGS